MKKAKKVISLLLSLTLIMSGMSFSFAATDGSAAAKEEEYMKQLVNTLGEELDGEDMFDYLSYVYLGWRTTGGPWQNQVIDDFARGELVAAGYADAGVGSSDQKHKSENDKSSDHSKDYVWTTYFNDISSLTWSPEYAKLEVSTEANFEGKDALLDRVNVESYAFDPTCDTYQEYYSDLYDIPKAESDDAWIDGMWGWITSKDKDGNRLYVNKKDPQAGLESKLQKRVHLTWNSCFTDDRGTDPKDAKGVTGEVVYIGTTNGTTWSNSKVTDLAGKVLLTDSSLRNAFRLAQKTGAVAVASKASLSNYSQPKDAATGEWIAPYYDSARYASGESLANTKAQQEKGAPIVEWQLSNNMYDAFIELLQKADKPVIAKNIAIGTTYAMNDEKFGGKGQAITVAEVKGSTKPDERVFLCAHVQEPGSNDNATGVAALLDMAVKYKQMVDSGKIARPERTITFMWGDEMSMATLYMSSHKAEKENLITVLDLDMVGEDPDMTGGVMRIEKTPDPSAAYNYTLDTLDWEKSPAYDENYADLAQNLGEFVRLPDSHTLWGAGDFDGMFQEGFYLNDLYMYAAKSVIENHDKDFQVDVCPYEGGSDHSRFLAQGVPAMLTWHFTDYTYHTSVDTLALSSAREMENVGITSLAAAIMNADAIDENEAVAFEMLEMMKQAAIDRAATEKKNVDNHRVYADKYGDLTAYAEEEEVLTAWSDWYVEAVKSVAGLLDKPSDAYKAAEAAAVAEVEKAYADVIAYAATLFPVPGELEIANVEELTGGDVQILYRNEVYKGDAAKGEDPDKYYTTYRDINLKDPRIFNFEFKVDGKYVGEDPEAFLKKVDLSYGGLKLNKWIWDGFNSSYKPIKDPVIEVKDKAIEKNADGSYTVKVAMESKLTWAGSKQNATSNIPYDNYGAGRQFDFSTGQSADNRAWWQAGPLKQGVDTYEMALTVDGYEIASRDMHIAPYDGMYSWVELNEFSQSIIKALTGAEYPKEKLDGHTVPDGPVAAGYLAIDENGEFVAGNAKDNVYVEVYILGFGLTDNYKEENKDFNNYSQYNAIWSISVSKDKETVDTYLNETVPQMNTDPQVLIDEIKAAKTDEDVDLMQVYYQNNVHSDEVTGTDTMVKLVNDLVAGGKAGKDINYKSWDLEDINLQYRDPAEGYTQGERGHVVKGGYDKDGLWMSKDGRNDEVFNTKEALDNFIFVNTLCGNPDGKAGMRRTNRYAFDLNRDAVFSTMPETIAIVKDLMKWDPLVMNEWHGYVTQMLIESCTAPHDPAYDYDLLQNNMLNLTYAAGQAVTGSTGMQRFLVPWDHYDGGDWDDGGTIYAPMFAMLLGAYGYTIEFPYSNLDSMDAGNVINYAMVNELLHGTTDFFPGNRLNGELEGVDGEKYASHKEDIKYESFRKASLISKLETKVRGINNIDAKETVDKYFIDKKNDGTGKMVDKVVGRARPVDAQGNELSFFPDYIVIPTDEANQYNVAEGLKAVKQMLDWNIEVDVSKDAVKYGDKEIPAGAYVLDMKQARRNVIFETMSKGYDATGFASMYADIYCNLPDVRGFDSIQIYDAGLFDGKLDAVASVEKKADIEGAAAEYVVFKSQSTDAVRFVNLLLSGKSSGGSVAEKGDVWMLKKAVEGVGEASDYIIKAADLAKIENLQDNPVINLVGCHIEGKYIDKLPAEAVQLVEPVIQFNTARTAQSGGPLWYMMDEYLGFGSMSDYNGSTALREGANVIIANNQSKLGDDIVEAVKAGTGIIFIRNANGLAQLDDSITAPGRGSFTDVAINGQYNVDDSLFTANYEKTSTYYARGYKYTDVPEEAKILFKSDKEGAFIGGFQNTKGEKATFNDATTMFSLILNEGDNPAQALVIGQQMDNRSHYQKLLPLLATAIYANAAGIYDDFNAPIVDCTYLDENNQSVVRAEDAISGVSESGVKSIAVYEGDKKVAEGKAEAVFDGVDGAAYKAVIVDYAGNQTEAEVVLDFEKMEMQGDIVALEKALEAAKDVSAKDKAALEAEIAALEAAAAKDKAAFEAEIAAVEKALADAESVNAADKAALQEKLEALEKALADESAAADKDKADLEAKLEAEKQAQAEEKAKLEAEIKKLEEEAKANADASAADKAALEQQIADLKAQIEELSKAPEVKQLAAPTNVKATNVAKTGKVQVSWKAVAGADEYAVYRATSKNGKYKKVFTTESTKYTNTSATAGKYYYYKVKAVTEKKSIENSEFSKVVGRTCDYARPAVTAKAGKKQVKLTWKKVDGAKKYVVYRATSAKGTYKKVATTTKLSYTNKNLKAKKTYYYKVKAIGAKNAASAYSLVDKCKTKA